MRLPRLSELKRHLVSFASTAWNPVVGLTVVAFVFGRLEYSYVWPLIGYAFVEWRRYDRRRRERLFNGYRGWSSDLENRLLQSLFDSRDFEWAAAAAAARDETASWVNAAVDRAWPFALEHIQRRVTETLHEKLRLLAEDFTFGRLVMASLDLRRERPKIHAINVTSSSSSSSHLVVDVDFSYDGDLELRVIFLVADIRVNRISFRGRLRLHLGPIKPAPPFFVGVVATFVDSPEMDFNFSAGGLVPSALKRLVVRAAREALDEKLVMPNAVAVKLKDKDGEEEEDDDDDDDDDAGVTTPNCQTPQGILKVDLVAGEGIAPHFFPFSRPDVYVLLQVGGHKSQSATDSNDSSPEWGQTFNFFIDAVEDQVLRARVYDEDTADADDLLGRKDFKVAEIAAEGIVDGWFKFEGKKAGRIRMKMEWLAVEAGVDEEIDKVKNSDSNPFPSLPPSPFFPSLPARGVLVVVVVVPRRRRKDVDVEVDVSWRGVTRERHAFEPDDRGVAGWRWVVEETSEERVTLAVEGRRAGFGSASSRGAAVTPVVVEFDLADLRREAAASTRRELKVFVGDEGSVVVEMWLRGLRLR